MTFNGVVGEELKQTEYSRAHRREYRRKVQLSLDVFETMLAQSSFDFEKPLTGMEIECNLVDADYQPAMSNIRGAGLDRRPRLPDRIGRLQHRIQRAAAAGCPGAAALELENEVRASLNAAEAKANAERRAHRDDRHPADPDARASGRKTG